LKNYVSFLYPIVLSTLLLLLDCFAWR
jgi:hypothetical protein